MPVFYRGPCARITHKVLEVHCPVTHVFQLRELGGAWEVRGDASHTSSRHPVTIVVRCTGAAGAAAVTLATRWPMPDGSGASLVALALFGAAFVGSIWYPRTRRTRYELWGSYRGQLVQLFATADPRTFGQVKRALQRAIDYRENRA